MQFVYLNERNILLNLLRWESYAVAEQVAHDKSISIISFLESLDSFLYIIGCKFMLLEYDP